MFRERKQYAGAEIQCTPKPEGGAEISIKPNEAGWKVLNKLVDKRSKQMKRNLQVGDIVIEALRVEQLLANKELLIRRRGLLSDSIYELESV